MKIAAGQTSMVGMPLGMSLSDGRGDAVLAEFQQTLKQMEYFADAGMKSVQQAMDLAEMFLNVGNGGGGNSTSITVEVKAGVKNASLKLDENGSLVLVIDDTNEEHVFYKNLIEHGLMKTETGRTLLSDISDLMAKQGVDEIKLLIDNNLVNSEGVPIEGIFSFKNYGKVLGTGDLVNYPDLEITSGSTFSITLNSSVIGKMNGSTWNNSNIVFGHELAHFRQSLLSPTIFMTAGLSPMDFTIPQRNDILHNGYVRLSNGRLMPTTHETDRLLQQQLRKIMGPHPY